MPEKEYKELILASLLHDIGKLVYRSKTEKGKHEELGELFYNEYISRIPAFSGLDDVRSLILLHHDPSAKNAILSKADGLSAGERESSDDTFTLAPLMSVFQNVKIEGKCAPQGAFYYRPSSLSMDAVMPEKAESHDDLKKMETELALCYDKVMKALVNDVRLMGFMDEFSAALNTLLAVLEKHLSLVPSAGYKNVPDVSLYDHMKTTAAIASCLYKSSDDEPFLLIEGDVSGIQNYIYNIRGSGAQGLQMSKRLRGRSFEICITTDAVVEYLLNLMELPRFHVVFNGGGNFIILAPNSKEIADRLEEVENTINRFLLGYYDGMLGIVLGYVAVPEEEIMNFGGHADMLKKLMAGRKQRKFQGILEEPLFGPYDFSEDARDVCPVCGRDFPGGSGPTCSACERQVEIGNSIPSRSGLEGPSLRIIRVCSKNGDACADALIPFPELGIYYYFVSGPERERELMKSLATHGPDSVDVLNVNTLDFLHDEKDIDGMRTERGFIFAGTNVPTDNNSRILSFEELAKRRNDGFPLISFLRLDVDNLGYIFKSGLQHHTISRFSSLSRSINNFFLWYVNRIASEKHIYITYSGGDDLFVAGHWKDVIEFSLALRKKFCDYTCGNRAITLSCGIALFKPNFPVQYGAEIAGKMEHRSKTAPVQNMVTQERTVKNAVTVFNHTVSWNRFIELHALYEDLYDLLEENDSSSVEEKYRFKASLIYRINSIARRYRTREDYMEGKWIPEVMHIIKYIFARRGVGYSEIEGDHTENSGAGKRARAAGRLMEADVLLDLVVPASMIIYSVRK